MTNERKTKLTDALVQILRRLLTPATGTLPGLHDLYLRDNLLALAGHGDGHILTVAVALLLAILTGRSDICIAGVFGAGKTRSLAVLLIALSCELDDFSAVIYTKENVAAKAKKAKEKLMRHRLMYGVMTVTVSLRPNASLLQPDDRRQRRCPCSIPTSANGCPVWLASMDESQQYGNYHEIAALAAIQQPALIVLAFSSIGFGQSVSGSK